MRAYATVIQLDLQVAAVTADVLAGRPVIYTTFLAYDEVAHHSGAGAAGHARGAAARRPRDRADRRGGRARRRGRTSSSCSPTTARARARRSASATAKGLEDVVERHCGGEVRAEDAHSDEGLASFNASVAEVASRDTAMGHAVRTAAGKRLDEPEDAGIPDVSVMASGNLGLISFPREPGRVTLEQIAERRPGLLDALRSHPGIAFLLVRSEHLGPVVLGPARAARCCATTASRASTRSRPSARSPPITCAARTPSSTARTSSSTAPSGRSWRRSRRSRSSSARTAGWAAARRTRSCCTRAHLPWPDGAGGRRGDRAPRPARLAGPAGQTAYDDAALSEARPATRSSATRRGRASPRASTVPARRRDERSPAAAA